MWGWISLETLRQDVRFGLRMLCKNPGFTAVVVLSLTLGIGANTAIFSLTNAIMLRRLPVKNAEQLVQPARTGASYGVMPSFSYPSFQRFRDQNHVFTGILGVSTLYGGVDAQIDGQAESVAGELVTGNFFALLGVSAYRGRVFTPQDDGAPGSNPIVVMSYGYWKRRFGLDPTALGKTITLHGTPFTVIGITPPAFYGISVGHPPDLYLPMTMQPVFTDGKSWLNEQQFHWLQIVGRLKPGVSPEQARADLYVINRQTMAETVTTDWSPHERQDFLAQRLEIVPSSSGLAFGARRQFSQPLLILMGMVGLVLLIACTNVANLLMARSTTRAREIAVRLAIGAGRSRLIRQLLTESVLLAFAGGAFGLLLAFWSSGAIVALMSVGQENLVLDLRPDLRVLAFTAVVSLLAGILFGLAPAFRSARLDLTPALKESVGTGATSRSHSRLGNAMVVSQVALSMVLLFGAGLFVRTILNLENVDPGFDRKNVLLFSLDPGKHGYQGASVMQFYRQALGRIQAIPGVRYASSSLVTPITGGGGWDNPVSVEGYTPRPNEDTRVDLNAVSPNFFKTLGTPLLLGRDFGPHDTQTSPQVAIINQAMARYFFGEANPIGKKFKWWGEGKDNKEYEILGVVKDAKYERMRDPAPRAAYLNWMQRPPEGMTFEVKTAVSPSALISQIRKEVQGIDKTIPVGVFSTLEDHVNDSLGHERLMATLSSLFGGLALLLACVGLYGVLSYAVARRTNEIGIRKALGAGGPRILWMVLRETLALVLIGIAVGLPAAIAASHLIASMLFGLEPIDMITVLASLLTIAAVTGLAGYIPARRASKVDPMGALRPRVARHFCLKKPSGPLLKAER